MSTVGTTGDAEVDEALAGLEPRGTAGSGPARIARLAAAHDALRVRLQVTDPAAADPA